MCLSKTFFCLVHPSLNSLNLCMKLLRINKNTEESFDVYLSSSIVSQHRTTETFFQAAFRDSEPDLSFGSWIIVVASQKEQYYKMNVLRLHCFLGIPAFIKKKKK